MHPPLIVVISSALAIAQFWSSSDMRRYFKELMSMVSLNLPTCPRREPTRVAPMMEMHNISVPPAPVSLHNLEEAQAQAEVNKTTNAAKENVVSHSPVCSCSYYPDSDSIQDGHKEIKDEKYKGGKELTMYDMIMINDRLKSK